MERTGIIIQYILKDLGMEEGLRFYQIKTSWENIFKTPLSLHTSPVLLKNGQLLINVDSPQWLQEISFYKNELIGRLSQFGVNDIRLKVGRVRDPRSR